MGKFFLRSELSLRPMVHGAWCTTKATQLTEVDHSLLTILFHVFYVCYFQGLKTVLYAISKLGRGTLIFRQWTPFSGMPSRGSEAG